MDVIEPLVDEDRAPVLRAAGVARDLARVVVVPRGRGRRRGNKPSAFWPHGECNVVQIGANADSELEHAGVAQAHGQRAVPAHRMTGQPVTFG